MANDSQLPATLQASTLNEPVKMVEVCGNCYRPKVKEKRGQDGYCNCGSQWFKGRDEKEVVNLLEQAFAIGCDVSEACLYAKISRQTYYNYVKDKPKLIDTFEHLRDKPALQARMTLMKALATSPDQSFKYLQAKKPGEFGEKKTIDVNVKGNIRSEHQTTLRAQLVAIKMKYEDELKTKIMESIVEAETNPIPNGETKTITGNNSQRTENSEDAVEA